jgi:hypothetical protein
MNAQLQRKFGDGGKIITGTLVNKGRVGMNESKTYFLGANGDETAPC